MEKKKLNYKRIITIFLVLVVWAAILLVFVDSKPIYGKWNCGENIVVEFSRTRSFEIYNTTKKDDIYIYGDFKAERLKAALPKIKYDVVLEADPESTENYKKELSISLNQTKLNEMTILEKSSKIEYKCKRAK